jgi:hypothetical protein
MRHIVLVATLALGACSSAPSTESAGLGSPPASVAPPRDASPAEVYRLYDAHRSRLGAELDQAGDALEALRDAGREAEFQQARAEILETVDPDALLPFLSDVQVRELAGMPVAERRMVHLMNIDRSMRPSQVEILGETGADDRTVLDVRGYLENPMMGQPGWRSGRVQLVRESSGWKVDEELWGAPASGEADAARSRLEVTGAVQFVDERPGTSSSRLSTYGGGWGFSLHAEDSGYALMFSNIPLTIAAGDHALSDRPTIPGDADPATLAFPLSATLGEISDIGGFDRTWDEDVAGTFTVESIEAQKISGHFEFTASRMIGPPVTIRGSFWNVDIPQP